MARLRTAIDSAFWDLDVSSPQLLEGTAKSVPGEPFPMDAARASRALRIQQISLMRNGFPLGIIPSFSPTSTKELGSFSLQSLLLQRATSKWYSTIPFTLFPFFYLGFFFFFFALFAF